jgi:hypothetical protein
MTQKTNASLTWGDLIVAITDDVTPFIHDPATRYRIVALIVSDLLSRNPLRLGEHSRDLLNLLINEVLVSDKSNRRVS